MQDDKFSMCIEYNACDDEELGKTVHNLQHSHFTNLQVFRAKNCNNVRLREFLFILIRRSRKLEVINIEECKCPYNLFKTIHLYEWMDGDAKFCIQLKELKLTKIYYLRYIWSNDKPTVIDLGNLQILHIKYVPSLKYIFHWYPPKKLYQLKELIVEACEALSTIFYSQFYEANFPLLSKVEFKSLPNLRQIYSGRSEFPSLKSLMIEKCSKLTKFTTGFADPHETLTTDGKSFFELNEIVFNSYDNLICVISSQTLQELRNLKKLFVIHCKELKIIFNIHEEISCSTHLLQQLHELTLIDLPKLTHIVNKELSKLCQNLKILQVKQCKSLHWLSMPLKLTNMEISDCDVLEKIIILEEKQEEEGKINKLTFHELKHICLQNMRKLSIIFPSISKFPSLQTLKIEYCSAMRSFVKDSKALTKSSTTNCFFPNSLSLEKLKEVRIINMDVEKLWHHDYPFESFCELENLSLINNNKLLSAISSSVFIRFKNLRKLTLEKCKLMIEVFDLEENNLDQKVKEILPQLGVLTLINLIKLKYVWNKEPQVSFFPNLASLYIVHCSNLTSLFSFSLVKNLGKLKILKLYKCDKLEEVISGDISEDENIPIIFSKLECLVMKDLPVLDIFYRQSRNLTWPNLKILRMNNIPKMEKFSEGILITPYLRSIYITFVKRLWMGSLNNSILYMHKNPGI